MYRYKLLNVILLVAVIIFMSFLLNCDNSKINTKHHQYYTYDESNQISTIYFNDSIFRRQGEYYKYYKFSQKDSTVMVKALYKDNELLDSVRFYHPNGKLNYIASPDNYLIDVAYDLDGVTTAKDGDGYVIVYNAKHQPMQINYLINSQFDSLAIIYKEGKIINKQYALDNKGIMSIYYNKEQNIIKIQDFIDNKEYENQTLDSLLKTNDTLHGINLKNL